MNLGEGVQFICFAVLTVLMLGSALGVVLLTNIVHSAFLLAGVFLSISGFYLLLNADFVATAQILIYVGAINVLILFAIMLVNKQEDFKAVPNRWLRQGSTALVCIGLFALLGTMVLVTNWPISTISPALIGNSVIAIGKHFFSDFLLPFELASILLLMAMVGAIILARRDIIPEETTQDNMTTTSLTLPERPREIPAIATKSSDI